MSNPIRILHIIGTMNRGGAETLLLELYRNIDRTKVQFDFLVYNYTDVPGELDEEILSLGGKIYNAKSRFYKNPIGFCLELKAFFKKHKEYKIIHSHQFMTSGYIVFIAKKIAKRVTIAHSHAIKSCANFLRAISNFIGKLLVKGYSDYIFGCSRDAVKTLCGKLPDNESRMVLSNAINVDKFAFSSEKREFWRQKLEIDDSATVIGYVARFLPVKNHDFVVKTFAEFIKVKPDSILVLVGDGPLRTETEELAKQLGVYDKVKLLGVRPDVQDIVNAFDVFVMPSRYEGLGIVLIEAQANGLPCVISADVIPAEADTGAGLVTRVSLDESPEKWAEACLNAGPRKDSEEVKPAIINSGYDINSVANWLQNFYIEKWN